MSAGTHEQRIQRLTELARRVWPELEPLLDTYDDEVRVFDDTASVEMISIDNHPRALDALEAALLVLAGEPSPAELDLAALKQRETRAWDATLEALGAVTTTGTMAQCIAHLGREYKKETELRKSHEANVAKYRGEIERLRDAQAELAVLKQRLATLSADWGGTDPRCVHMVASDCANELDAVLEGKFAYLATITAKGGAK